MVHPPIPRLDLGATDIRRLRVCRRNVPVGGWRAASPLKESNGAPTVRSIRLTCSKRGIAYGARALWRRSLHSSPRAGKPSTWRREAGVFDFQESRGARDA